MPRRYKRKKKRPYRKRQPLSLKKSPMPRRYMTKLRYAENGLSLDAGAGIVVPYIFSANDCYDPNYSGTGHQPRGFDQLMPLYNHFTVLGSKITVRFSNEANSQSVACYLTLQGENTTQTNPIDYMERQDVKTCTLAPQGGGSTNGTLTQTFSAKRFFGPSRVMDDTSQRGSAGGSPSERSYYHIGVVALNGSTDISYVPFSVVIDYIVMFHEPNDVASS